VAESKNNPVCPRCGAPAGAGACRACGHRVGAIELRVVPADGDRPASADLEPPDVDLVREYKGPTVSDLLAAPKAVLDLLPGRVRSMEEAVRASDLAEADRRIDQALGLLLRGPGHRRRRLPELALPALLWLWFAVLLALLLWVVG
jgi:hypothetical protein